MLKRNCILALLAGSLGFTIIAHAFTAPYLAIGAGAAYVEDGKLGYTSISRTDIDALTHLFTASYSQANNFNYVGRSALGCLFYKNNAHYGLGFEVGFNYFGKINNKINNALWVPSVNVTHGVTSNAKTISWATDLEGVYRRSLNVFNTSFLVKFGIGYKGMSSQIDNFVEGLPGELDNTTVHDGGIGVAAGIGLDYHFSRYFCLRLEADGLKGKKGIGYVTSLVSVVMGRFE